MTLDTWGNLPSDDSPSLHTENRALVCYEMGGVLVVGTVMVHRMRFWNKGWGMGGIDRISQHQGYLSSAMPL